MPRGDSRAIALTFDDAPRLSTPVFDGATRTARLVAGLEAVGVTRAAFFANTIRLGGDGQARLAQYAAAGHAIGNHTHSHLDVNRTDLDVYLADLRRADTALSSLNGFVRLFRFPFLREGPDATVRDCLRNELARLGYLNAYVTVNAYDWALDRLIEQAVRDGRPVDYAAIGRMYVDVILACAEFYDALAVSVLGRSPRHVLLLHENDINALFLPDLVTALRHEGWTVIAPEEAYADPIATLVTRNVFHRNPGRIGEIASDCGCTSHLWHESCDTAYWARVTSTFFRGPSHDDIRV
jgi:peptidoglycan/xylan/chitin deacetylase (PgdA/CDA1 family)